MSSYADGRAVLEAIDAVIQACRNSQAQTPDPAVQSEIEDLLTLRTEVLREWPLSHELKERIKIGPVAAKNLADWNEPLADVLMLLHHVLKHDGEGIESLTTPA